MGYIRIIHHFTLSCYWAFELYIIYCYSVCMRVKSLRPYTDIYRLDIRYDNLLRFCCIHSQPLYHSIVSVHVYKYMYWKPICLTWGYIVGSVWTSSVLDWLLLYTSHHCPSAKLCIYILAGAFSILVKDFLFKLLAQCLTIIQPLPPFSFWHILVKKINCQRMHSMNNIL